MNTECNEDLFVSFFILIIDSLMVLSYINTNKIGFLISAILRILINSGNSL